MPNQSRPETDAADRFWRKVDGGDVDLCWRWTGWRHRSGYGRFQTRNREVRAHRWSYEQMIGEIPDGLFLDHLCRNRACVNPWHLEPVNNRENLVRGVAARMGRRPESGQGPLPHTKSHCRRGHERNDTNGRRDASGHYICWVCKRRHQREYERRRQAAKHSMT